MFGPLCLWVFVCTESNLEAYNVIKELNPKYSVKIGEVPVAQEMFHPYFIDITR